MPLDPQAQILLDAGKGLPPLQTLTVEEARSRLLEAFRTKGEPEYVNKVEDRLIPGSDEEIPIRIYSPACEEPAPVLVFYHGGGGVVNNLETHDAICRNLANSVNCIVVSVDYRLAPENKYPAAFNDCYIATKWVYDNAGLINGDSKRIAVGGDSSGAGLAAGVALKARNSQEITIVYQLLIYPVTDYLIPGTTSYETNGVGYSLTKAAMEWFFNHYLPDDFDRNDEYLFPLTAKDLSNLPPALIMTGEYDPLRDEGEMYAERLKNAGVSVGLHRFDGMMHGYVIIARLLDKGRLALEVAAASLRAAFAW